MGKKGKNKNKKKAAKTTEEGEAKAESKDDTEPQAATSTSTSSAVVRQRIAQESALPLDKRQSDKVHKFWSTQPVLQGAPGQDPIAKQTNLEGVNEEIETKEVKDVRPTPYNIPKGFVWDSLDLTDDKIVSEVYTLLKENYVEDDDSMFRFEYSRDFLKWCLMPPGFHQDLHIGVRVDKKEGTGKLVGFITGTPADICVYKELKTMVEINFLCVHKKLRTKRLAPVLIKEVTRRTNLMNVWQAVYTAGVVLPQPVASNRYYHRSLQPKKLIDIGFSRLKQNMTMSRTIKFYKLPAQPQIAGLRPMEPKDVPTCTRLLRDYLARFAVAPLFKEEEFAHFMLPREGVITTYVTEDPETKKIENFFSFYNLPSQIMRHARHTELKAAYSFYNVATTVTWQQLMNDALTVAAAEKFDVFNCLNVMQNDEFLKDLKFGMGDGNLQYYLYNWRCQKMEPHQVGLVLM